MGRSDTAKEKGNNDNNNRKVTKGTWDGVLVSVTERERKQRERGREEEQGDKKTYGENDSGERDTADREWQGEREGREGR